MVNSSYLAFCTYLWLQCVGIWTCVASNISRMISECGWNSIYVLWFCFVASPATCSKGCCSLLQTLLRIFFFCINVVSMESENENHLKKLAYFHFFHNWLNNLELYFPIEVGWNSVLEKTIELKYRQVSAVMLYFISQLGWESWAHSWAQLWRRSWYWT